MTTGTVTQYILGLSVRAAAGKLIEGESTERYEKSNFWTGANGTGYTMAAFLRMPVSATPEALVPFLQDDSHDLEFSDWDTTARNFYLDSYATSGYGQYTDTVASHGIDKGDWFAFMFSIDYSGTNPVIECWVHKEGDSAATDIMVGATTVSDTGPITFSFDDTTEKLTIGYNTYWVEKGNIEVSEYFVTNEVVDWSDPLERAKFVSSKGHPVGLGATGASLTGTAAKIYLPDGDGTINVGTAGNFTASGTITNSSAPPSYGSIYVPITQALAGHPWDSGGPIAQSFGVPSQSASGTFAPGTDTGSITQNISAPDISVTAYFFAGTTRGPIAQTLPGFVQAATGTVSLGIDTGIINQTFALSDQNLTATFLALKSSSITQSLNTLSQASAGTYAPSNRTSTVAQSFNAPMQQLAGTYGTGISRAEIFHQALPTFSQNAVGTVWDKGEIAISINPILQSLTASFAPGVATGSIAQTIPVVTQSAVSSRLRLAVVAQTTPSILQTIAGAHQAGITTANIAQALSFVGQSAIVTHALLPRTTTIAQEVSSLSQVANTVFYRVIEHDGIVFTQPEERLLWERLYTQFVYEQPETEAYLFESADEQLIYQPEAKELLYEVV